MSFIIEQIDRQINSIISGRRSRYSRNNSVDSSSYRNRQSFVAQIQKRLSWIEHHPFQINYLPDQITINILFPKIYKELSFMLQTFIREKLKSMILRFKLINDYQGYTCIDSKQRRLFAARLLPLLNTMFPEILGEYKITFQSNMGLIVVQFPTHLHLEDEMQNVPHLLSCTIKRFFKEIKYIFEILLNLLEISNENASSYACDLLLKRGGVRRKRLQTYSGLMNMALNLGSQATYQEKSLKQKILIEQDFLDSLNQHFAPFSNAFQSGILYSYANRMSTFPHPPNQTPFSLDDQQKKEILNKLEIAQVKQMLASGERKFVVNHIKLAKGIQEDNMTKIACGGFSDIYLSEVEFYPLSSHAVARSENIRCEVKDIKTRHMIIKKELNCLKPESRSRLQHQKNILLNIKSALSIFLPKYYLIFNVTAQNKNYLLMEHIYLHSYTLSLQDYVQRFKTTLSQQTIVFLAYQISQGLRYLKDYRVVHLDIKLSNIMVSKKLAVKIIDFGESFHPSLQKHRPGFSIPYSAPECFGKKETFDSKCDVFSFGVMLYYLLTEVYPFYTYSDSQRDKVYGQGSLSERWFLTPEGLSFYGENNVFPFLQLLVARCLEPNPKLRPQLQWISLVLREYLDYFR